MNHLENQTACAGAVDPRFALKGTEPRYAPDRWFDTEHIRLEVRLDLKNETLDGFCRTKLRAITPTSEMVFDAVNFRVLSVAWNGRKAATTYRDGKLTVKSTKTARTGERVTVDIKYRVTRPKLGLYFIKPTRWDPRRPTQVWTQGEDEYARYWFPCHDAPHDRTTTEVIATVPSGFTAVSNGRLIEKKRGSMPGTTTFHWRQSIPHATYLVTLAVGRFSEIRRSWRGVPVVYYCEKGREAEAERAFGKTPRMLEFFSSKIGVKYPFHKYAQVAAAEFIYGGMENTSATTQTDAALLDERVSLDYSSDELVAHELAHQWFGDYLTCKHWSHAWLNESFATYFDALFKRFDKGEEEYLYQIRRNSLEYLAEYKDRYGRPLVTSHFRRPTDLFDRHLYEKGSVILYMLHHWLGENLFWKSIRTYVKKNAGCVVETTDLIQAIEIATGRDMRRFFDQWVYGAGHPEYKVRMWWDERKKEIAARVIQTNAEGREKPVFQTPVDFLFLTRAGEKRFSEQLTKKSHMFRFKLPSKPEMGLFDPDHRLLKKVDFPKEERWLFAQLRRDKNALGRIDAAHALAELGSPDAIEALRASLLKDAFWGVQAEAAEALGRIKSEQAAKVLLHSLDVIEHPKVRRAIYAGLRFFKSPLVSNEIEKRYRREPSYFAEMEGLRILGSMHHPKAAEHLQSALKRDSWNDVIRAAALEGLAAGRAQGAVSILMSHTHPRHSYKLRLAAIRCLAEFGTSDGQVQAKLLQLAEDPFTLVQVGALRVLRLMGDERALPVLKKLTTGDRDGRIMRLAEEAIDRISKGLE